MRAVFPPNRHGSAGRYPDAARRLEPALFTAVATPNQRVAAVFEHRTVGEAIHFQRLVIHHGPIHGALRTLGRELAALTLGDLKQGHHHEAALGARVHSSSSSRPMSIVGSTGTPRHCRPLNNTKPTITPNSHGFIRYASSCFFSQNRSSPAVSTDTVLRRIARKYVPSPMPMKRHGFKIFS